MHRLAPHLAEEARPHRFLGGLSPLIAVLALLAPGLAQAQGVPELSSVTPANGATGVALDAPLVFVFDRPMMVTVPIIPSFPPFLVGNLDLSPAATAPSVVGEWSEDGLTLTCTPSSQWPANTALTWKLNPAGSMMPITSEEGEPLPADTYSGGFTTAGGSGGCTPDGIPDDWGGYTIAKGARYAQTSTSDPVPESDAPYHFNAMVLGPDAGPAVTSGSLTLPSGARKELESMPFGSALFYLDEPASGAALEAAYPPGTYTLRFTRNGEAERVIPMTMPVVNVPIPKIANFAEAQSVNHAQAFTLRWNAFTGAGANDSISLYIADALGNVVFQAPDLCVPRELPVTATSIILPANTLQNNMTYSAGLHFFRMFYFSTNAVPDMAGSGSISRHTRFTIKTGTGGSGTAAQFTGYRVLPNGNPEMTLAGTPLAGYSIQRTQSIGAPAWTTAGRVTMNSGGTAIFEDTGAGTSFPVFYRAVAD